MSPKNMALEQFIMLVLRFRHQPLNLLGTFNLSSIIGRDRLPQALSGFCPASEKLRRHVLLVSPCVLSTVPNSFFVGRGTAV